jgi:hypothetical protein
MQPFINFMVILGTALIAFVEFSRIGIINVSTERNRGVSTDKKVTELIPVNIDKLKLTAIITDSTITFGAGNGFLPTLYYSAVKQKGGDVDLVLLDSNGKESTALHQKDGRIIFSDEGKFVSKVTIGDKIFVDGSEVPETVKDLTKYRELPVNIALEIERQLRAIHQRFSHLPDADAIVVAAEQGVVYDRIVKMIDASSRAGFTDVAFSRPRISRNM